MKVTIDIPVVLSADQKTNIVRYLNGEEWTRQFYKVEERADQHDINHLANTDGIFKVIVTNAFNQLIRDVETTVEGWFCEGRAVRDVG